MGQQPYAVVIDAGGGDAIGEARIHINIPIRHYSDVLTWDQATVSRLAEAAIDVAVKVGIRLDEDEEGIYLREAQGKGCDIDWANRAVMFSKQQIEDTISVLKKTQPVGDPVAGLSANETGRGGKYWVGNGANLVFDWDNWEAKAPTVEDLRNVSWWAQGNDDVGALFNPFMLKDVDQRLTALYDYVVMAKYCRKNVYHEQPTMPLHVKYLPKMQAVVKQSRGYDQALAHWEYVNPPFRMGKRSIETMLARVDMGVCRVMGIGPMSMSGMSSPVTVSGHAVAALAELLVGLALFNVLRPGYGLNANVCTGALDLRTARVSFFGMHTHLNNLALMELLSRGLGVGSWTLTFYRDANEPGMQALYEYGMSQAFFSCLTGRTNAEIGGLCNGNMFSPHQAVLDMEVIKEFDELMYGFEASEEALAVDEIIAARFNQGYHMSSEHTLDHMMDGVPFSSFLFRGMPAGAQHNKEFTQTDELMRKAEESVNASVAKGRDVEPDHELGLELYEFVKAAASELGIEAPPMP